MKRNLKLLALTIFGSWMAGNTWAIEPVGDVYQIGSAQDWAEFAEIVNKDGRQHELNAVLTKDFTLNELVMVGIPSNAYRGIFDGQGHTITINFTMDKTGQDGECGLFRRINGATIKNLKVAGTITTSGQLAGGVVSGIWQTAVVENCVSTVTIIDTNSGDATHGGIVARISDKSDITIRNCAFFGTIDAPNRSGSGGILGWPDNGGASVKIQNCLMAGTLNLATGSDNDIIVRNSATITNCYYVNLQGMNNSKNATLATAEQLASGELCYLLNGLQSASVNWYQTIGTDNAPMPIYKDGAVVYANGFLYCDGDPKPGTVLENEKKASVRDSHNFVDGFCVNAHDAKLCDEMQADYMSPDGEGNYLIGTKQQLKWFAHKVNGHKSVEASYNINGKLTADIDFSDQTVMIGGDGNATAYRGTFDGQGHKVTLGYNASQKNVALFRTIAIAHIKNLITDGTIQNENNSCAGGIFAGSHGASVVENCVSYVTLSRTNDGDATFGGIGAYMHDNGTIQNCGFYGSINTPSATGNGGLLGYANGGGNIAIKNCVVNATAFVYSGNSVSVARNTGNVTNTYVVNAGNASQNEALHATAAQVESGELAYKLNGDQSDVQWYQVIGTDAAPLPIEKVGATVYARGSQKCDGTPKPDFTYVNEQSEPLRDAHDFSAGLAFCATCDKEYNPSYAIDKDGEVFLVDDATELKWFAAMVNAEGGNKDARLTADIDFDGVAYYPGIGTTANNFVGELDGQKHKISHLTMDFDQQGVGVINRAGVGVRVKNLLIDNTCSFTGKEAVAAFIGGLYGTGGTALVENCGNEAPVTATSKNAGALVGCNYANNENRLSILNCYNTAAINSKEEGGALSGWVHNEARVINCYNTGALTGCEGFIRGYGETIANCFSTSNTKSGDYGRAANNELSTGADETIFAALYAYNENDVDGSVWRMGDTHPVLYGNQIAMREDCNNRIVAGNFDVKLYRAIKAGTWNTFVVPFDLSNTELKAAFGDDVQIAEYSETAEGDISTVTFNSMVTAAVTANKPVLLKTSTAKSADEPVVFAGRAVTVGEAKAEGNGNYDLVGSYAEKTIVTEGDYYLSANKLYKSAGNGSYILGTRAYIKAKNANARVADFLIDGDGETTAINGLRTTDGQQPLYNLNGQRMAHAKKGLYISGGRKVVVK